MNPWLSIIYYTLLIMPIMLIIMLIMLKIMPLKSNSICSENLQGFYSPQATDQKKMKLSLAVFEQYQLLQGIYKYIFVYCKPLNFHVYNILHLHYF